MEFVIGYLVIGLLIAAAYRIYFKGEASPIKISKREAAFTITILWLPLLVIMAISIIAAGAVDYLKRK